MISLCLFLIGGLISYIANAGVCLAMGIDQLFGTSICGNSHYQNMVIIIIAVLIYPIACLRDMRVLAKTSMIGMACMFYTLVLYFIAFIYHKSVQNVDPQIVFSAFKPFQLENYVWTFSDLIFAFVNHFTIISIIPTLHDSSSRQRLRLTFLSSVSIFCYYLLTSINGFVLFGSELIEKESNKEKYQHILQLKLHADLQKFQAIGLILVSVMLISSFPLLCDPIRSCVEKIIMSMAKSQSKNGKANAHIAFLSLSNLIISGMLVAIPTLIATTIRSLTDKLLSMFSALAGSTLVLILPTIFLIKLRRPAKFRISPLEMCISIPNLIIGILIALLGTWYGIQDVIKYFNE
jgi:amino acid permease